MLVLANRIASPAEFVSFWRPGYDRSRDDLYLRRIHKPLSPESVADLFDWKNGSRLSQKKTDSVEQNFIARLPELTALKSDVTAQQFLERFSGGGAIWRIFWLHLWQPERHPIFDQHAYRAMRWIQRGAIEELPTSERRRIETYLTDYVPFVGQFDGIRLKDVDEALWSCGKCLKALRLVGPLRAC